MKTTQTIARTARLLLPVIAALLAGCHREPAPPLPTSASAPAAPAAPRAVKLPGAPAHVLMARFAPDGASLLVLEERRKRGGGEKDVGAFVISRRPIGGAAAVDLFAPAEKVLDMVPLGSGLVAYTRPLLLEEKGEPLSEGEGWEESMARVDEVTSKMALHRIADGAAPARVSPEGMRCTALVGASGGQWVAFSLVKSDDARGDAADETHVLGAQPGEEITLGYRSRVYGISPDGARVLLHRRPGKRDARKRRYPPTESRGLVMVTVKGEEVSDLPQRLLIDGVSLDTAEMRPRFLGDGLSFTSAQGEIYRSALDGSGATRLADRPPSTDALDAGAPEHKRRCIGPRGTFFQMREDTPDVVVLSARSESGALEPTARFEGPLAGIVDVVLDDAEKRAALVVLSDTSRDGQLDERHDDAELFLADLGAPSPVALGFGRAAVSLLADEIRPKLAAAAQIPEASVTVVSEHGEVTATVAIPWVEGEDAPALFARMLTAARAAREAVPNERIALRVRAGTIDLGDVFEDDLVSRHNSLFGYRVATPDPTELTLVQHDPRLLSTSTTETFSGELENTGVAPTPPIEVYAWRMEGPERAQKLVEHKKELGVLTPGQRVEYSLSVPTETLFRGGNASFRAEGRRLAVLTAHIRDHILDALTQAIAAHARHGVWMEHRQTIHGVVSVIVRLTAEQATLDERARKALFDAVAELCDAHRARFHKGMGQRILFADPGGGGWKIPEVGAKITRFEGTPELQLEKDSKR